jgi:SPP1 family predicted phage head-tail adaptor
MRIADLNKRFELQAPTKVSDGRGGSTTTYATAATVWGALWPLRGDELIEGMKLTATITHRIRIRYRTDIKASWRIKLGNRYFSISAAPINMGEENKYLEIMVKEAI